jgi:hypothetical protein
MSGTRKKHGKRNHSEKQKYKRISSREKLFKKLRQQRRTKLPYGVKYNKIGGADSNDNSPSSENNTSSLKENLSSLNIFGWYSQLGERLKNTGLNNSKNNSTNEPSLTVKLDEFTKMEKDGNTKIQRVRDLRDYSNAMSSGVKIVAPFLVASGIGMPLAGALFLVSNLANMYSEKLELKLLFLDIELILTKCFYLNNLIVKTIEIFKKNIKELNKKGDNLVTNDVQQSDVENNKSDDENQQSDVENNKSDDENQQSDATPVYDVDKDLQIRIVGKLDLLTKYLIKISPETAKKAYIKMSEISKNKNVVNNDSKNDSNNVSNNGSNITDDSNKSMFMRFKDGVKERALKLKDVAVNTAGSFDRLLNSKLYKETILRELTFLNSLFIMYNSKYDWIIQLYERTINKHDPKKLAEIWDDIENEQDYKNYIDTSTEDPIQVLKKQLQDDPNAAANIANEGIDTAIKIIKENNNENAKNKNTPGNETPGNETGGGYKSKKKKRRNKYKTRKH